MEIRYKVSDPSCTPRKAHPTDSCFDLFIYFPDMNDNSYLLSPGYSGIIPTGLFLDLPVGWEARVRGRSGNTLKGLHVHHGTIDSDYKKEVGVIISNVGNFNVYIAPGDKIAQLTFARVPEITLVEAEFDDYTDRGGFGSTGR